MKTLFITLLFFLISASPSPAGVLKVYEAASFASDLTIDGTIFGTENMNIDNGALYVDSVNNRVGVGTTVPTVALEVNGAGKFGGTGASTIGSGLTINDDSGGGADDDFVAETNSSATAFVVDASGDDIEIGVDTAVTGSVSITADLTIGGSTHFNGIAYNWPASDGSATNVLTTNGANGLSWAAAGAGGGAPTDATYITQTADGDLSAEQNLDALAAGILYSNGSGVIAKATADQIETDLTNNAMDFGSGTLASGALTVTGATSMTTDLTVGGATHFNGVDYNWPALDGSDNQKLTTNGNGTLTWKTVSAGSSTEVNELLKPQSAKLPTSNPAVIDAGNSGWRLLFDDTTQETATWEFILDDDYGAGTLYADVFFSMASGEADEVQWEVYVMAVTATTDNADWDTDSYDTENVGLTTVAATAGRPYKQTITLTNDDSLSAGDLIRIKISTDSDDAANDDAAGDREFRYAVIRE